LRRYFAQKRNVLSARPYQRFSEIRRFNREAARILERADAGRLKLGHFLDEGGYTTHFLEFYLYSMAAAWSSVPSSLKEFPAAMLIRFFDNHGMLTVDGHPQWKNDPRGCSSYIAPIAAPYRERIVTGMEIHKITRDEAGVTLSLGGGERPEMRFDHVVFATNGDRVLPLLADASDDERTVLRHFHTGRNDVVLHTDENLLPLRPALRGTICCTWTNATVTARSR
jgi:uncharacterized protein